MTAIYVDPIQAETPDYAAGSLLRNLGRPIAWKASWGLVKTVLLSILSFGVAPLLIWPRLLRDLQSLEHNRFLQLADWMRTINGDRSRRLMLAADRLRPNPVLVPMLTLLPLGAIGVFVVTFMNQRLSQQAVIGSTWGFFQNLNRRDTIVAMYFTWTATLFLGYLLHWIHLLVHQSRVRDAVVEFNHLAAAEGLGPIPVRSGFGVRPAWLIAGVGMLIAGSALWAIPMVLGGALQRRYAAFGVPAIQGHLGHRVRQLLSHRRPAMFVPTPVSQARKCPNDRCRAPIARVANFCQRCGTHVGPEFNALA